MDFLYQDNRCSVGRFSFYKAKYCVRTYNRCKYCVGNNQNVIKFGELSVINFLDCFFLFSIPFIVYSTTNVVFYFFLLNHFFLSNGDFTCVHFILKNDSTEFCVWVSCGVCWYCYCCFHWKKKKKQIAPLNQKF